MGHYQKFELWVDVKSKVAPPKHLLIARVTVARDIPAASRRAGFNFRFQHPPGALGQSRLTNSSSIRFNE